MPLRKFRLKSERVIEDDESDDEEEDDIEDDFELIEREEIDNIDSF